MGVEEIIPHKKKKKNGKAFRSRGEKKKMRIMHCYKVLIKTLEKQKKKKRLHFFFLVFCFNWLMLNLYNIIKKKKHIYIFFVYIFSNGHTYMHIYITNATFLFI